jgi:hypothetical protein
MADKDKDRDRDASPLGAESREDEARPAARQTSALAELMEGARALQAVQAQVAQEALRLPEPRLDEADAGYHFETPDGRKVDANGNEWKRRD